MSLPDENGLRAAKDEIVGTIAREQGRHGLLPRPEQAEDFARPILDKIAQDDRDARRVKNAGRRDLADEEYEDALGTVKISRGGAPAVATFHDDGTASVLASAAEVRHQNTIDSHAKPARALRLAMRVVAAIELVPSWTEPWKALLFEARTKPLPPGHTGLRCAGCAWDHCRIRDTAVRALVMSAYRAKGDPLRDEEAERILRETPPAAGSPFGSVDRRYLIPEADRMVSLIQAPVDFGGPRRRA